jgi:hypothetical protein
MEIMLIISAAFLLGALACLGLCLHIIFKSQIIHIDKVLAECSSNLVKMDHKVEEFREVTAKASAANQSWAQAITDFDLKLKDLENRVAMTRMQR